MSHTSVKIETGNGGWYETVKGDLDRLALRRLHTRRKRNTRSALRRTTLEPTAVWAVIHRATRSPEAEHTRKTISRVTTELKNIFSGGVRPLKKKKTLGIAAGWWCDRILLGSTPAMKKLWVCLVICSTLPLFWSFSRTHKNSVLRNNNNEFRGVYVVDWLRCIQDCAQDVLCVSYNYYLSERVCELNSRGIDRTKSAVQLQAAEGAVFQQIRVSFDWPVCGINIGTSKFTWTWKIYLRLVYHIKRLSFSINFVAQFKEFSGVAGEPWLLLSIELYQA